MMINPAKKAEMDAKWKKIATLAVTDESFKNKLAADPLAVMGEYGLNLPETLKTKTASDKAVLLIVPPEATEELRQEAAWWKWRLDTIHEFNAEIKRNTAPLPPKEGDV